MGRFLCSYMLIDNFSKLSQSVCFVIVHSHMCSVYIEQVCVIPAKIVFFGVTVYGSSFAMCIVYACSSKAFLVSSSDNSMECPRDQPDIHILTFAWLDVKVSKLLKK